MAGASLMIIEISAIRLLAPFFGNSLHTWTALIGVILICFSLGGYLGGIWADKAKNPGLLAWLLGGAAVLTMLIPSIGWALGPGMIRAGLIAGPVLISIVLFAIPGILLGAVSPASVRFYAQSMGAGHVGAAAGVISMLGSLGSFAGTFLSGFVLLAAFGVKAIFLGTGTVLMLLALLAYWMSKMNWSKLTVPAVVVVLAALLGATASEAKEAGVIHEQSSFYHRIRVKEENYGGRPARSLYLDNTLEGGVFLQGPDLPLSYQNYWQVIRLNEAFVPRRALFIGAGAFGMPELVSVHGQGMDVDVAEIDPAVINVGQEYFRLKEYPRVTAHAKDGRLFVRDATGKYDLIFGDAYNGIRHIPAHLVTREFFQEVKNKLTPEGVFLMNIISSVRGDGAELLRHIHATVASVFPHVEVFAVNRSLDQTQNLILLGSETNWRPMFEDKYFVPGSPQATIAASLVKKTDMPPAGDVLTDDWNPIDAIVAHQLGK